MKVDLDGLASNIKAAIGGPRREEWCFMVDELVRNVKELEAVNKDFADQIIEYQRIKMAAKAMMGQPKAYAVHTPKGHEFDYTIHAEMADAEEYACDMVDRGYFDKAPPIVPLYAKH
jgi:hypothetical protein